MGPEDVHDKRHGKGNLILRKLGRGIIPVRRLRWRVSLKESGKVDFVGENKRGRGVVGETRVE